MEKIESLTKENFWNELSTRYPEKMQQFREWIDEYKARVNWDWLFGNDLIGPPAIKYHDLPIALQVGIFFQFMREQAMGDPNMRFFAGEIEEWFKYSPAPGNPETDHKI